MDTRYAAVLEPIRIGSVTVPNRLVRAPYSTKYGVDGLVSDQLIRHHVERARGGIGMSIVEIASVHPSCSGPGYLIAHDDAVIDGWGRLADAVHAHGMVLLQQLWHGGNRWPGVDGSPPWSASNVPSGILGVPPVAMTAAMMDELVGAYAAAALRARTAGMDGVEIHAAHGYLLEQFLSPLTNRRDDEYGGSVDNRLRFPLRVLDAVREAVGPEFVVGTRIGSRQWVEGGLEPADMATIARRLQDHGVVDFLDVTVGVHESYHKLIAPGQEPHGYQVADARRVTAAVRVPTIVTGRILTLEEADGIVTRGDADLVSMVRATIAEPALVRRTLAGERPRPCIGVNACVSSGKTDRWVTCAVNPSVGFEADRPEVPAPAAQSRRVAVIGGGPAGLEAARVAALRGHDVVLFEASDALGGQLRLCRDVPGRGDVAAYVDWLAGAAGDAGVEMRTGVLVDAARPDVLDGFAAVVVGTGPGRRDDIRQVARPASRVAGLSGVRRWPPSDVGARVLPHAGAADSAGGSTLSASAGLVVADSWEVLDGRVPIPARVVVLDDVGHHEGYSVAEYLLERGAEVTFVTRHVALSAPIEATLVPAAIRHRFGPKPFTLRPRSLVVAVASDAVVVGSLDGAPDVRFEAGLLVTVTHHDRDAALADALSAAGHEVHLIGDARAQRFLQVAVAEAYATGMRL